jgi:glutaminyl-tRNA synthetase
MSLLTEKMDNFIQEIIDEDLASGYYNRIHTRFPPEPNAYLHIGHAKAICLNVRLAATNQGLFNLRFDDTNPSKEELEYVDAIKTDVRWLAMGIEPAIFYASDYFEQLYEYAVQFIKIGKAYVCDLTADQIKEYRGTLTTPGQPSPYRNRSIQENLELFEAMREGEFPDGAKVLRAKIDMASPNINMRDPVMYRILRATHHRTGDDWCIYPMYDYAHPISDAIEGITHSICTLEFEDHRPLYNWFLEQLNLESRPKQIEFARLYLTRTLTSKRRLRRLVEEGYVYGFDDPRMPTLAAIRRRGYTPEAIHAFCDAIGVAKTNSVIRYEYLEHFIREDLNKSAQRVMAVLNPLKVVITNYPIGEIEEFETENNPEDPQAGFRKVPFSRIIYIEKDDFMEDPPKNFYRLAPGREVRLKNAYYIRCDEVVKDPDTGEVMELRCSYDPESRGGSTPDGRKVRATLHWVCADTALKAEVRLYDHLFLTEDPEEGGEFINNINPHSLQVLTGCYVEPSLAQAKVGDRFQFLRHGYFCVDPDSEGFKLVFNRTVSLKDTWSKVANV